MKYNGGKRINSNDEFIKSTWHVTLANDGTGSLTYPEIPYPPHFSYFVNANCVLILCH